VDVECCCNVRAAGPWRQTTGALQDESYFPPQPALSDSGMPFDKWLFTIASLEVLPDQIYVCIRVVVTLRHKRKVSHMCVLQFEKVSDKNDGGLVDVQVRQLWALVMVMHWVPTVCGLGMPVSQKKEHKRQGGGRWKSAADNMLENRWGAFVRINFTFLHTYRLRQLDAQPQTRTWQWLTSPILKHPLGCLLKTHTMPESQRNYPAWVSFSAKNIANFAMGQDLELEKQGKHRPRNGSMPENVKIALSNEELCDTVESEKDAGSCGIEPKDWPQSDDARLLQERALGGHDNSQAALGMYLMM